jgi:hypothetical protein
MPAWCGGADGWRVTRTWLATPLFPLGRSNLSHHRLSLADTFGSLAFWLATVSVTVVSINRWAVRFLGTEGSPSTTLTATLPHQRLCRRPCPLHAPHPDKSFQRRNLGNGEETADRRR